MVSSMVSLPSIRMTISRRTLAGNSDNASDSLKRRPNLIYRKAKVTGRSVDELKCSEIPVPKIHGEVVFGVYPVLEALATGTRTFFSLYMKDTVRSRSNEDERISSILDHARILGLPVKRLTHSQFDKITDFQLHNGVCLDATPLPFARDVTNKHLTSIYLDNVLDPNNIGAIARSALFFGCGQIAIAEGRGPSRLTSSMSKASCGALESFRIVRVSSFLTFYEHLKSAGAMFIGTSDATSAEKYGKQLIGVRELLVQEQQKIVLVLAQGDEGMGISEDVMSKCDILLTIESASTRKTGINSLNVSVVAGILLHHIALSKQSSAE